MISLTQEKLKELLEYNPETGVFTWKKTINSRAMKGYLAGTFDNEGYIVIRINGKAYKSHRLAFLYMLGKFPENLVDHINTIKCDNRWRNLREADGKENQWNSVLRKFNTSSIKNVCWHYDNEKWNVSIKVNGKYAINKYFDSLELAELVAEEARELYHGKFARHF